jgi:putative sterol carrier protein
MNVQAQAIDGQAALARAIAGKSDREISGACVGQYTDVVHTVAEQFPEHFIPERAIGWEVIIGYEVTTPDGLQSFLLEVRRGRCMVIEHAEEGPDLRLRLAFPDFLRLVCGQLSPTRAFFSGRLKITGSVLLAKRMQSWFRVQQ